MAWSTLRHSAATLVTGGRIETYAEQIESALRQSATTTADQDIATAIDIAVDTIPFYRRFSPRVSRLEDLPVIDKVVIRSDLSSFLRPGVALATLRSRSTSGSTGIPFTVYQDHDRTIRNQAGAVASLRYAGGDPFAPSVRARAWSTPGTATRVMQSLRGVLAFDGAHFRREPVLDIARWMRRRRRTIVQGYTSYLERILHVFEDEGVTFRPGAVSAVVSGAEAPTPYLWDASERVFGVRAFARYSNMELGVMSTSSQGDRTAYRIDTSTFHVEILAEDSDEPVAPGELGRIVVTDLHNRVMPLLRYDTGDLARFTVSADGREIRNEIRDIHGRRLDVLVAGTREAPLRQHPLTVTCAAGSISQVRQFQLVQHDVGRFTWRVNAERSDGTERQLRALLDEKIGDIVSCDIAYVDEVSVLASGKRQPFVSEIDDPLAFILQRSGEASLRPVSLAD